MEDLLGFDDPAPVAAAPSADFGAFQGSSAPTPAGASDDFAAFDQIRSKTVQGPDAFAAAPLAAAVLQPPASFDAFGNNNAGMANNTMMPNNMMNNNMMPNNMMNNNAMPNNMMNNNAMPNNMMNNNMMPNNMAAMGNAFNNMSVGAGTPAGVMQQPTIVTSNDDDFGDFEVAKVTPSISTPKQTTSNPMSGLINLDGLSKNPSKQMTANQPYGMNSPGAQYQQGVQNGFQGQGTKGISDSCFTGIDVSNNNNKHPFLTYPNLVKNLSEGPVTISAGGSDAISSMFAPAPPQQQMGSNFSMNSQAAGGSSGMPANPQMQQQQQQQFNINQGMPGNGMNNMMGGNPQMQGGMMYGNQMGGMQGGMMNNTNANMNMNQMGGQQQQMNNQMNGGMGMQGGVNQMGGMQGGMNQMGGMQGGMNQMGNMGMQGGMGGQQQSFR